MHARAVVGIFMQRMGRYGGMIFRKIGADKGPKGVVGARNGDGAEAGRGCFWPKWD